MPKFTHMSKKDVINLSEKLDKCAGLAMEAYNNYSINMNNNPAMNCRTYDLVEASMDCYLDAFRFLYRVRFPNIENDDLDAQCEQMWTDFYDAIMQMNKQKLACEEFQNHASNNVLYIRLQQHV